MTKDNFDENILINCLIDNIPEFEADIVEEFKFSAYIVYGDYGIFLKNKILGEPSQLTLIERAFKFINEIVDKGDEKTVEMFRVSTFEILSDRQETIDVAKKYLKGRALEVFSKMI